MNVKGLEKNNEGRMFPFYSPLCADPKKLDISQLGVCEGWSEGWVFTGVRTEGKTSSQYPHSDRSVNTKEG